MLAVADGRRDGVGPGPRDIFEVLLGDIRKAGLEGCSFFIEGGRDGVGARARDAAVVLEDFHRSSQILNDEDCTCLPALREFPCLLSMADGS